jgi:hypothetical protein
VALLQAGFVLLLHIKFKVLPSPWLIALAVLYLLAIAVTVRAAWTERFYAAIVAAMVSAGVLYIGTFRIALPNIEALWPSQQVADVADRLRPCGKTPFLLTRYREPSAIFFLGTDTQLADETAALEKLRKGEADFALFNADAFNRIARQGGQMPQVLACINAFNTVHVRKVKLHVLTMKPPEALAACPLPAKYDCINPAAAR